MLAGERKTVTALFADIKGSMEMIEDLDPEEASAIVDPALKLMMEAVQHYGGYVAQSTGDGIFALFGAPIAHEDHPQRRLLAALRMQQELKRYSERTRAEGRLPIQVRVGVNTGEVVVRMLKTGEAHSEYVPVGHSISLPARMQALAPIGSIAVTEQVRKLCEGYFAFEALGATKVKGVSEPVNVYEVTGLGPLRTRLQRSASRGYTKFVGREWEMEALRYAAEQARAGRGQIGAAIAEPGVGKSRLFFEFKAKNQSGWMVLEGFDAIYNHDYWDFGKVNGIEYSYAKEVAAHGFPAFAFDEIGSGSSSRPSSDQVTLQSAAFVAHQIVQGLRSGSVNGVPLGPGASFAKVIIVGHSLGSTAVWQEAVSYGDVDGVIITGAAHAVTKQFLTSTAFYPAVDDPKFVDSGLDTGYLTTMPGTRLRLFHSSADVDPAIVNADESAKDVVSLANLQTGITIVTSTATLAINVPVLDILGSNDFTTCGLSSQNVAFDCSSGAKVTTQEVPFYSSSAQIHACVVPASGHAVSLAVNHRLQAADAVAWSFAFVGQSSLKHIQTFVESDRALPWNDNLPWNCGAASSS